VVLLDVHRKHLFVIDDGKGFSRAGIREIATLGGGDKIEMFSDGGRHISEVMDTAWKSTLNIANKVDVRTVSKEGEFQTSIDWARLDEALRPDFEGYPLEERTVGSGGATGTVIQLYLKQPTTKQHLDKFGEVLANLPREGGKFRCYFGLLDDTNGNFPRLLGNFGSLKKTAVQLCRRAGSSSLALRKMRS
jgi:hypothetical protein